MTSARDNHSPGRTEFVRWMDILRQIKELYGQLTEAEHAKREAVRLGGSPDIQAATDHQQRLLARFDELDAERREAMVGWQQARGIKPDARATLSGLMALLDDEAERSAVREIQRELREAARRLKTAAEANRDLLQVSLDAITARIAPGEDVRDDYTYAGSADVSPTHRRPSGYDIRM